MVVCLAHMIAVRLWLWYGTHMLSVVIAGWSISCIRRNLLVSRGQVLSMVKSCCCVSSNTLSTSAILDPTDRTLSTIHCIVYKHTRYGTRLVSHTQLLHPCTDTRLGSWPGGLSVPRIYCTSRSNNPHPQTIFAPSAGTCASPIEIYMDFWNISRMDIRYYRILQ